MNPACWPGSPGKCCFSLCVLAGLPMLLQLAKTFPCVGLESRSIKPLIGLHIACTRRTFSESKSCIFKPLVFTAG